MEGFQVSLIQIEGAGVIKYEPFLFNFKIDSTWLYL